MDNKAMFSISYGLYVLTAKGGNFQNGCIINTLQQLTTTPNRVSITVSKANYTNYLISQSLEFNVSVIDESADFSLFEHFGFHSGRWENKFSSFPRILAQNGIVLVKNNCCACLSCKVVQTVDLGSHTMFIAEVTDGEVLSNNNPMTYAYYHAKVKPKPQVQKLSENAGERWVCNICGYVYEGKLPEDFICPICKHGAADFTRIS